MDYPKYNIENGNGNIYFSIYKLKTIKMELKLVVLLR